MISNRIEKFWQLLRMALGLTQEFDIDTDGEMWQWLFETAACQGLTGVCYQGVSRLPAAKMPPLELTIQWAAEAEHIKGKNELLNQESARLTKLFGDAGRRSAILKGQANARLYPDKFSRAPGDIDIWVEGGRESVISLLVGMGLLDEVPTMANIGEPGKATASYHHVHLPVNENRVSVEVHFRPSSGNHNPFTNRRLQQWLEAEIMHTEGVAEGFNVPSVRFALVMQLSHVQRHFMAMGIGLRQIIDYYWLLRHSSEEDRWMVAAYLKAFGLRQMAGAVMWVLGEALQLDRGLMLCEPDSYRGEWLLCKIMEENNMGQDAKRQHQGMWRRVLAGKLRHLRLLRFNFWEVFWGEMNFWKTIVKTLPVRIRRRSFSLGEARKRDAMK
jgi:hypothetical protein